LGKKLGDARLGGDARFLEFYARIWGCFARFLWDVARFSRGFARFAFYWEFFKNSHEKTSFRTGRRFAY
jgi:hypothetical protein